MKIMQVVPEFRFGGAETMCANLSIELKKRGHEVLVVGLYRYESAITKRLTDSGIEVVFLDKKPGLDPLLVGRLVRLMRSFRPDAVHTHLYAAKYAQFAAILAGVHHRVHTIHNMAQKDGGRADHKLNRILFRHFGVIPVSLSVAIRQTVTALYGIPQEMSPVILNGVPLEKCGSKAENAEFTGRFIHVGRFSKQKNHEMLIPAFIEAHKTHNQIELFLFGEGELEESCREMVTQRNAQDYIHFCGVTGDVYSQLARADVFLLPSLWEGIPITIIEAMGTGLPIIASRVGGVPDMLEDGVSGLLIDPEPEQLTRAIEALAEDADLRAKLGSQARLRADAFSASTMARAYEQAYMR